MWIYSIIIHDSIVEEAHWRLHMKTLEIQCAAVTSETTAQLCGGVYTALRELQTVRQEQQSTYIHTIAYLYCFSPSIFCGFDLVIVGLGNALGSYTCKGNARDRIVLCFRLPCVPPSTGPPVQHPDEIARERSTVDTKQR
jgi:hypothetical protein